MIDELSGQLIDAAKNGDAQLVSDLLRARDQRDLENTVKKISELQKAIFKKESEREALCRELEHLAEPVQVAATAYATALDQLEECRIDLAKLQARQGVIDLGLESLRQEINELRNKLNELMPEIVGGTN
ncbi:MAG TPA: hypothetical protein VJR02_11010 [Pyrinomonadaceae bacterium]|nr:hypothetical protein [Pyrinomonadaceae bacterium]